VGAARGARVGFAAVFELLLQANPFGPVPTPTPTPIPGVGDDDVSRQTLYLIALAVLVAIVAIGYLIARDARRALPRGAQDEIDAERPIPDLAADQRERRARDKKQRSKAKAARRARRHNR